MITNVQSLCTGGYFGHPPTYSDKFDTWPAAARALGDGATLLFVDDAGRRSLASIWSPSASLRRWGRENAEWLEHAARCIWPVVNL